MTVFWDSLPYCMLEISQHFGGAYCLHHQSNDYLDGSSKHFLCVSPCLPDFLAQLPRRQSYSYLLQELEIHIGR
jgi:hypothetical protein